jgi:hypothetical protein
MYAGGMLAQAAAVCRGPARSEGLKGQAPGMSQPQSLRNHTKRDVAFHMILLPILLANLVIVIVWLAHWPDFHHAWLLVLSVAALLLALKARQFPVKVQDRLIRLEERLRLQALAPAEWHTQIYKLNEDQLIGLRFAGDDEVVALARQALEENLSRKQIKERIRNWRSDNWRA